MTSDSTEDYDRGEKLRHYKDLPSVHEVLVVSHRAPGSAYTAATSGMTKTRRARSESSVAGS